MIVLREIYITFSRSLISRLLLLFIVFLAAFSCDSFDTQGTKGNGAIIGAEILWKGCMEPDPAKNSGNFRISGDLLATGKTRRTSAKKIINNVEYTGIIVEEIINNDTYQKVFEIFVHINQKEHCVKACIESVYDFRFAVVDAGDVSIKIKDNLRFYPNEAVFGSGKYTMDIYSEH